MAAKRSLAVCFPSLPPSITLSPRPCLSRQLRRLCLRKGQEFEEQKAFSDVQGTSRSAAAWGRFPCCREALGAGSGCCAVLPSPPGRRASCLRIPARRTVAKAKIHRRIWAPCSSPISLGACVLKEEPRAHLLLGMRCRRCGIRCPQAHQAWAPSVRSRERGELRRSTWETMWLSWPAQEVPTRLLLLLPKQPGAADRGGFVAGVEALG